MSALTLAQQRALAILPKLTGGLSFVFSFLIAMTILRDSSRRRLCYHRLLCGISLADMSASAWMFLSTWPIPAEDYPDIVYAAGNATTCKFQAFFLQFGVSSPFYNASLSIYYWLVIVRGWKAHHLHRVEWALHALPLGWAAVSAVLGLWLDVYDSATLWCWVGAEHKTFRWAAYYGPLWFMIVVATACCISIYWHVRQFAVAAHVQASHGNHQLSIPSTAVATTTRRPSSSSLSPPERRRRSSSSSNHRFSLSRSAVKHDNEMSSEFNDRVMMNSDDDDGNNHIIDDNNNDDDEEGSDYDPHAYLEDEEDDDDYDDDEDDDDKYDNEEGQASAAFSVVSVVERRIVMPATFARNLRQSRYIYRQSRRMREIAQQCFLYAAAFYINFAALTATRIIQTVDPDKVIYPVLLAAAITVPMQGLPNFMIYLRPKIKKAVGRAMTRYCGCCCGRRYDNSPPWWYQLAKSLSEKNHHNSRQDGNPDNCQPERHVMDRAYQRPPSSAGVVCMNPTILNDTPYFPPESETADPVNAENDTRLPKASSTATSSSRGGEMVLVVVDTTNGRKWSIESTPPSPKKVLATPSSTALEPVMEALPIQDAVSMKQDIDDTSPEQSECDNDGPIETDHSRCSGNQSSDNEDN